MNNQIDVFSLRPPWMRVGKSMQLSITHSVSFIKSMYLVQQGEINICMNTYILFITTKLMITSKILLCIIMKEDWWNKIKFTISSKSHAIFFYKHKFIYKIYKELQA